MKMTLTDGLNGTLNTTTVEDTQTMIDKLEDGRTSAVGTVGGGRGYTLESVS